MYSVFVCFFPPQPGDARRSRCVLYFFLKYPCMAINDIVQYTNVHFRQVQCLGGRGCNIFVPVLGENGTKIAPIGEIFDQPPGQMRWIWAKLADHVGDHLVSSPEGAVLVTSPETKSSYPRPPQSLNPSLLFTQAPIPVCLDGTNIDSSTILVTMYYCGYVGVWLVQYNGGLLPDIILLTQGCYQWGTRLNTM